MDRWTDHERVNGQMKNDEEICIHGTKYDMNPCISKSQSSQGNTLYFYKYQVYKNVRLEIHFFFNKNLVYKNIKASNSLKIKNILRTYEGFKS